MPNNNATDSLLGESVAKILGYEEGGEFGEAAGVEAFVELAFVVAVGGVGFEDVAVAGFEFFEDGGFVDHTWTAVVG